MKIIIPGGTGQLGQVLRADFELTGDEVVVLTRKPKFAGEIYWNGKTQGDWVRALDGADAVINLAGRTVNCRYTKENLQQMMNSRVDSTRAVGEAIRLAKNPPMLWLQMSTATIYRHTLGEANDEATGVIGGNEPDVPGYWAYSVEIAKAWESEQELAVTPHTRKVAMRTAMVMAPRGASSEKGVFEVLLNMTRLGLAGSIGGGKQFVSWIHYTDFCRAVRFVIEHSALSGAINFTAPNPLPQGDFMRALRSAAHAPIGLPAAKWMAEIGAFFLRTDTELLLKSRRVVPTRLLNAGFIFQYAEWSKAAEDLVKGAGG